MDIGTGIAVGLSMLSIAAVIIKLFAKPEKPEQCAVHGIVVEHLQEGINKIAESVEKIEKQLFDLAKTMGN